MDRYLSKTVGVGNDRDVSVTAASVEGYREAGDEMERKWKFGNEIGDSAAGTEWDDVEL